MKKKEMRIRMFRFINGSDEAGYTYEICFSNSLENTARMDAMIRGLKRYDRWRKFWFIVHILVSSPLALLPFKWTRKFNKFTFNRY